MHSVCATQQQITCRKSNNSGSGIKGPRTGGGFSGLGDRFKFIGRKIHPAATVDEGVSPSSPPPELACAGEYTLGLHIECIAQYNPLMAFDTIFSQGWVQCSRNSLYVSQAQEGTWNKRKNHSTKSPFG